VRLPVRDLLAARTARLSRRRRTSSFVASLAVHLFVILAFLLAPVLSARGREPLEYVAVQIVPVQMLGSSTPTPPPPPQPRETPPAPEPPEPEPPEPEPIVEPPREEPARPLLPDPQAAPPQPAPPPPQRVEAREASPPGLSQREGSPTGSRLGTSQFGAAVGFDNPDFTYTYYVDQVLLRIREQWVRPPLGGKVEAMVHFRIHRDGTVTDVSIVRSSGYNSFDLAALRAVQNASPLPRLPDSYDHDSVGVNLIVR
jgi:protein TonB